MRGAACPEDDDGLCRAVDWGVAGAGAGGITCDACTFEYTSETGGS